MGHRKTASFMGLILVLVSAALSEAATIAFDRPETPHPAWDVLTSGPALTPSVNYGGQLEDPLSVLNGGGLEIRPIYLTNDPLTILQETPDNLDVRQRWKPAYLSDLGEFHQKRAFRRSRDAL